jgi:hypothetical protein
VVAEVIIMGGTEVITTGGTEVTVTGSTEVPTTVIGMTGMMMMIKGCASTESGGQTARALQTLAPTENSLR